MKTVEIKIFDYEELDERAQDNAKQWYLMNTDYLDFDDCINSVRAFCDEFGIVKIDYSFNAFDYCHITVDEPASCFRGRKLKEFKPDHMPTGFYIDSYLWETFYKVFKETGDCKRAFNEALDEATDAIRKNMEEQHSDEYIIESLTINAYQFTEDGRVFRG